METRPVHETYTRADRDNVIAWRLHVLLRVGYPVHDAELLAEADVDLHEAVRLIELGCPVLTAVRILI